MKPTPTWRTALLAIASTSACAVRPDPARIDPPLDEPSSPASAPIPAPEPAAEWGPTNARPLTPADALYVVAEVAGRIVPVRDVDGDGLGDLIVARGPERDDVIAIDLLSSKDGTRIRRLLEVPPEDRRAHWTWDAGGDVDGDVVPDLIVGFPEVGVRAGRVRVHSGRDANLIREHLGADPIEGLGSSIAFIGDVDGDGRDDYAVGAIEADPDFPLIDRKIIRTRWPGRDQVALFQFEDGSWVERDLYYENRLDARSREPGFVRVHSGRDGTVIWRTPGWRAGHGSGTALAAVGDLDADRAIDLVVRCDPLSRTPPLILSGASGREIGRLDRRSGPVGGVGDVDRDGVADVFVDTLDSYRTAKLISVRILSGRNRALLFELPYPDYWTEYETTVGIGDLDGDGHADIALGDGNFNLIGEDGPGPKVERAVDLSNLTLKEAVGLESKPWNAWTFESGCAVVYSGRTRQPIFGVWALPGSRRGLGLEVAPLPDVNGDGAPDLIVADGTSAYAFAGPGRISSRVAPDGGRLPEH